MESNQDHKNVTVILDSATIIDESNDELRKFMESPTKLEVDEFDNLDAEVNQITENTI